MGGLLSPNGQHSLAEQIKSYGLNYSYSPPNFRFSHFLDVSTNFCFDCSNKDSCSIRKRVKTAIDRDTSYWPSGVYFTVRGRKIGEQTFCANYESQNKEPGVNDGLLKLISLNND